MLEDLFHDVVKKTEAMLEEGNKFDIRGNKAAGTRCRLLCQELKTTLQEIRNQIQTTKKGEVTNV